MIDLATFDLLGRHIARRADQHVDLRERQTHAGPAAFGDASNSEVEDFQPPLLIHHEVRRLDIAVDDAGLVGLRQPGAQLGHELELLRHRQGGLPLDHLGKRLAADVLHHDERRILELAGVVDVDDVGVVQGGQGTRLAGEPLAKLVGVERRVQQFERDETIGVGVEGEVEIAHPASPDEALDFVAADVGWQGGHGNKRV